MWQTENMIDIISQKGHALEDSESDVCRFGIVDIIHMGTNVFVYICPYTYRDYHIY